MTHTPSVSFAPSTSSGQTTSTLTTASGSRGGRHSPAGMLPPHGVGQSAALSYLSAASTLGEDPDTLARLVTDCTFAAPSAEEAHALPSRIGVTPSTFTFAQQSTVGQSTHPSVAAVLRGVEEEEKDDLEREQDEEGEVLRPLGGFERFFGTYQSLGLGLIFFIADLEGPVDCELLQRAMRMQVKRHPNLRSVLVQGGLKAIPFSRCPKVKVARVESDDVVGWTEELLNNSIKIKQGTELYLWSLHLHYTPATGAHQLVFLIHHALSDGDSINQLLQDIVASTSRQILIRQASRSRLVLEQSVLPQLPAADMQLRRRLRGAKAGCGSFLSALWTTIKRSFSPGRVPVPVEQRKYTERGTCISSFVIDPADLKRVLAACKAHGTTLTGALASAAAQEMEAVINKNDEQSGGGKRGGGKRLPGLMKFATAVKGLKSKGMGAASGAAGGNEYMIRVDVLVNFRRKAAAPSPTPDDQPHPGPGGAAAETAALADKAHQLFAAPVDIMIPAGNTPATRIKFWEAAAQVRKEIITFLDEPHQIIDCLGVMNTLGGALGQRKLKSLADGPLQGRSRALSISNLGVTDGLFTPTPAGVSIGRTQWGIDEGFVGHSLFLACASYRGHLNFTLSYSPSIFTREMAVAFGEGIKARLAAAADGTS